MRRAIYFELTLLLLVVMTGCGQASGSIRKSNQASPAGQSLTDLHDVGDLQARFNQDAGKPRLLLLVSPT